MVDEAATTERPGLGVLSGLVPRTVVGALGLGFVVLILLWLGTNLVDDPSEFFNVFFIGLTNGAVYALVALGYTLVYGILQLINFAHGDVFALSGLVASTLIISVFELTADTRIIFVILGLLATLAV